MSIYNMHGQKITILSVEYDFKLAQYWVTYELANPGLYNRTKTCIDKELMAHGAYPEIFDACAAMEIRQQTKVGVC